MFSSPWRLFMSRFFLPHILDFNFTRRAVLIKIKSKTSQAAHRWRMKRLKGQCPLLKSRLKNE